MRGLIDRRVSMWGLETPSRTSRADLDLLGGEVVAGLGGTFARALARGEQLAFGARRKLIETHPGEHLDSVVPIANMLTARPHHGDWDSNSSWGRMASPE